MENVDDIYPLTSLQRGMLFHSVASPGSGVYVEQITARIDDSDLDVQRFRDAWKLLVERHPALRTLYLWEDLPEPLQVVRSEVEIPWRMEDYADMAPEQAEEQLQSILGQERT